MSAGCDGGGCFAGLEGLEVFEDDPFHGPGISWAEITGAPKIMANTAKTTPKKMDIRRTTFPLLFSCFDFKAYLMFAKKSLRANNKSLPHGRWLYEISRWGIGTS